MQVHRRGMAPGIKPILRRPRRARHRQAIAGIVRCAAYLCGLPIGAHMRDAHFFIGFKSARGEDDGIRHDLFVTDTHADHAGTFHDQARHRAAIAHGAPHLAHGCQLHIKQAHPLVFGSQRQPAPKHVAAILFKALAAVDRFKLYIMRGQPKHGVAGRIDQQLLFLGQRPPIVESQEVLAKFLGRIAAKIGLGQTRIIGIAQKRQKVLCPVIGKAHRAGSILGVAPGQRLVRLFQQRHLRAFFQRCDGRAQGRVSGSDNDD
mmetsp:Transcript_13695/g.21927  ORF Transcript_13695/g.21927 Transcript_13695/m.21927 type:complete len:261 (+) Transcript_13695:1040-1822(+)